MTEPTATPLSQSVELQLTSQPDVKNKYGSGRIRPRLVVFYYLTDRTNAHLYGSWVRDDGELTDAPADQLYRHDDDWPDWLAALARQHAPDASLPPAPRAAEAPLSPDYEHPECGFHWHGRDGMDIPMRDGQPVCPRCELRTVERRLRISERRRDELREESLRRGKIIGDYSEKNRLLEREIDGVRRQLGAEILRANQAETELRRMADEEQPAGHVYLSTGCLHGDLTLPDGRTGHQYCQSMTGHAGAKRPGECKFCCKFCAAPCQCPCHTGGEST